MKTHHRHTAKAPVPPRELVVNGHWVDALDWDDVEWEAQGDDEPDVRALSGMSFDEFDNAGDIEH